MTRALVRRPAMRCAAILAGAAVLSGCALFRSGPAPAPAEPVARAAPWSAAEGEIALDRTRYTYAMHSRAPMVAQPPASDGAVTLGPATTGVDEMPVLVLARAGRAVAQEDHGEMRRVAAFLCAERPDWPRARASDATPDWIESGRWHLVAPCAAPVPPAPAAVVATDTAPPGLPRSVWAAPAGAVGPFVATSGR